MAKIKYYYDTNTCKYERVSSSIADVLMNIAGFAILSIVFSLTFVWLYFTFFDSPKEALLKKEINQMKSYYELINHELTNASKTLKSLTEKDKQIYRVIFEAEPSQEKTIAAKDVKLQANKKIIIDELTQDGIIASTLSKIATIKIQLQNQQNSFNEILNFARLKEKMLSAIPAIQPISNKQLRQLASGFGFRIHPIYKVKKFHTGIDFSAVRGTPIYATGNGIAYIPHNNDGYGNCVEIAHGYGYLTRYGHMDRIKIKNGSKVKRGEVIGFVGSSGTATSPHLHYEVHKNGKIVDPIHYFFNDLTPKEYENLLKLSAVENQSLGGN